MVWPGVGARGASLRCPTLRSGSNSVDQNTNPAAKMSPTSRKCLRNEASQGITDLVLSSATSLAGFEVTTYGRFSGDHRGQSRSAREHGPNKNARLMLRLARASFKITISPIRIWRTRNHRSFQKHAATSWPTHMAPSSIKSAEVYRCCSARFSTPIPDALTVVPRLRFFRRLLQNVDHPIHDNLFYQALVRIAHFFFVFPFFFPHRASAAFLAAAVLCSGVVAACRASAINLPWADFSSSLIPSKRLRAISCAARIVMPPV